MIDGCSGTNGMSTYLRLQDMSKEHGGRQANALHAFSE